MPGAAFPTKEALLTDAKTFQVAIQDRWPTIEDIGTSLIENLRRLTLPRAFLGASRVVGPAQLHPGCASEQRGAGLYGVSYGSDTHSIAQGRRRISRLFSPRIAEVAQASWTYSQTEAQVLRYKTFSGLSTVPEELQSVSELPEEFRYSFAMSVLAGMGVNALQTGKTRHHRS